jgi:hypothetical protein
MSKSADLDIEQKEFAEKEKGFFFDEKEHAYFFDGKPLMGITSVLSVISKPALIQWAANEAIKYIESVAGSAQVDGYLRLLPEHLEQARTAHRKKKEDAAEKGTDLHALIEEYVTESIERNGGKPLSANVISGKYEPISRFIVWAIAEQITFLEAEKRLYSKELWIAGTCDLVFQKDGKTYIGDIKTYKKLWDRVPMLQCAGYGLMWEEMQAVPLYEAKLKQFSEIFHAEEAEGHARIHARHEGPKIDGYCVIRIKDGEFETKWSYDVEGDRAGFLAALTLYRTLQNWAA